MCGICGIAEARSGRTPQRAELEAMNNCQIHRGPDDDGFYSAPGIGLAMRRLSIIDVAGGAQPQSNEDGTVWVVYNGEIYNYLELKTELEARGHVFRTRSDTEVIIHGYEEWGTRVVERLRGMFAIALWDTPHRRLMLARDRFGVKPIVYTVSKGRLLFASSIRSLLADESVARRTNLHALEAMFTIGFVPAPLTMFEGIYNVPAAHRLIFEDGAIKLERYWDIDFTRAESSALSWDDAVAQFRARLDEAVDIRRMSEVPLGALLSGGIDSSSIVALLQAHSAEPIHTISIGFESAAYNESEQARLVAERVGTQHHAFTFDYADFNRLPEVLAHLEQPQCSATSLPIYLLYEKCRAVGLTVVLTGEGSDEMLGGYHWYRGDAQAQSLLGLPAPVRSLLAASPLEMSAPARRVLRSGSHDVVERYAAWQMVASPKERAQFLTPESVNGHSAISDWQTEMRPALAGEPPFHQMQYIESHTRMIDFINLEVDRLSMAHSIEARAPFLDYRLWEFCAALPARLKLDTPRGAPEKNLLRAAMRDALPAQVIERRKQGLAAPHHLWLSRERLPEWAEQALAPASLAANGYFDSDGVARLRAEHIAGRRNHSRILMGILTTQLWHAQFIS